MNYNKLLQIIKMSKDEQVHATRSNDDHVHVAVVSNFWLIHKTVISHYNR